MIINRHVDSHAIDGQVVTPLMTQPTYHRQVSVPRPLSRSLNKLKVLFLAAHVIKASRPSALPTRSKPAKKPPPCRAESEESELTQATSSETEAEDASDNGGDDDDDVLEEDNGNSDLLGLEEADLQEVMALEVSFHSFALPLI